MKTLLERMSDHHVMTLKKEEISYPTSIKCVMDDLQKNYFWLDLKYNTICMLNTYLKLESCNPSAIDDLFSNK